MHPILARPGRLLPYLAACAPFAALVTVTLARPGGLFLGEAAALAFPLTIAYAFMGLSAWYPCRQFPLTGARVPALVLTHLAGAAVASCLWVLLGAGLARLYAEAPGWDGLPDRFAAQAPGLFAAGMLLYLLSVALHYVLIALEAAREAERREAEVQILAREAELALLKAQIQPHFLYNSLNSISSLAASDPPRARQMCLLLADFLRSISVAEELSLSRSYLAVEELRFGARLLVEEERDERADALSIPPLVLQPLVENAIRHGIAACVDGGTVRVSVACGGGRLRIVVENPIDPDSPPRAGEGVGLANVRQRLAARYGHDALFAARKMADRFLVVISVPAERPA